MKKFATLIMGLTAVFALTACGGKGTEVKEDAFKKEAEAIEEHEYTSATLKYSYSAEEGKEKESEKGTVTYTKEGGSWKVGETDLKYADDFSSIFSANLKDLVASGSITADIGGSASQYGMKATTKYYKNPLGIETKASVDTSGEDGTMKGSMSAYIAFDKYGYVTKVEYKVDMKMSFEMMGEKVDTAMKMSLSATVSYK